MILNEWTIIGLITLGVILLDALLLSAWELWREKRRDK